MPKLGLTMTEGTIEKWLKQEGDLVEKREPLLEIITEKINFQYESPASGTLLKILHHEGEVVPVAVPIAIIAEKGEALPEFEAVKPEIPMEVSMPAVIRREMKEPSKRVFASPIARKIAQEKGMDLSSLKGSGPGGRIIKIDVLKATEKVMAQKVEAPPPLHNRPDFMVSLI